MQNKTAQQILSLIDLTSLNDNDTKDNIKSLCYNTTNIYGHVPAICIYSRFIPYAKELLQTINPKVKIATVVNFPYGSGDIELATFETELAITRGADEVDLVFPYHDLMHNNTDIGYKMLLAAKKICGNKTLKVIIESGMLHSEKLICNASEISIEAGADFIKTSTGKAAVNATLDATEIILNVIKNSGKKCGFKASGGIKTVAEASKYLELTAKIMGTNFINANNFRFGASSLLNDVVGTLASTPTNTLKLVY
jgi:deoxyribose-phosphate aldolase